MKHFVFDGKTYDKLPDPCGGVSPMTEMRFIELGGVITDDGEPTPQERVLAEFAALLSELAEKVECISVDDFMTAARSMHSGELVAWAREHGVDESVISEARGRIVEILADALRFGMSWAELMNGAIEA